MTSRAVFALGIGQCVNWGVLYYAFGVLLLPVERDLGVQHWIVAGAFSVGLLVSAAAAPTVGRWSDRGHGPQLIEGGGLVAALLFGLWALFPSLATLYIVWAGLGLCMAATLYEPAFVVIGRAHDDPAERLKALAAVTLFGGMASTLFLPITAVLVERVGWRGAVGGLAVVLAISTLATARVALRTISTRRQATVQPTHQMPIAADTPFVSVLLVFSVGSLASAAFTTIVFPAFVERNIAPTTAAMLGGLLGIMQLPGRALLMKGTLAVTPSRLLIVSLLLQASGLAVLVFARTPTLLGLGVALFALGGGLTTLIRPLLVQRLFGTERAGRLNGSIAGAQQLARAAGPVTAVAVASLVGYAAVFGGLAALFAVLAVMSSGAAEPESAG